MPLPSLVNGLVSAGSSGGAGIVPPILPATPRDTLITALFEDFGGGVDKSPSENYAAWCLARNSGVRRLHFGNRGYRIRHEFIGDWVCKLTASGRGATNRPTGFTGAHLIWEGSGAAFRTVKTRVKYRAGPEDPEDDPVSACINIQVPGFEIDSDLVIELDKAATDWSYIVFAGCRTDIKASPALRGKAELSNFWFDLTRLPPTSPELIGWDGRRYPSSREHGGDGFRMDAPSIVGSRWGFVAKGPDMAPGLESYGWDYKMSHRTTFLSAPAAGVSLRLGDITLVFATDPTGSFQLSVPATKTAAVTAVYNRLLELLGSSDAGTLYPEAYTATYLLGISGDSLLSVRRDRTATDFDEQWTCETNAPATIDVGTGAPSAGEDPAPYWDGEKLVQDNRGAYGFSDPYFGPGIISSGPDGEDLAAQRMVDIRPDHNHLAEGLSAGGVYISAKAGNGFRAANGIYFDYTRVMSIHPFGFRFDDVASYILNHIAVDRQGVMSVLDTNGVPLSETYASKEEAYYGPVSNTKNSKYGQWKGARNAFYTPYYNPSRNGGQMIGSITGPNILKQLNVTQYIRAGEDPDGSAGDARGVAYLQMGRVSGYGAIVFEDGAQSWLAAIRYFRSSGRLTREIAGSQLVYETLTADGWVQTTTRPGGFSIRATDTGTGAGAELRAGANAPVRLRQGTTLVGEFTTTGVNFPAAIAIGGVAVINAARHFEDHEYTRGTLPTPTTANKGRAAVTNPESGKTPDVRNTGTVWVYLKDYTNVTIS